MNNQTQDMFKRGVLLLLPEHCYKEYFENFNFLDVPCLKLSISKALGLGIIAGSLTVKFPQIVKIWNAQSAQGVSFVSVLADLFAVTAVTAYSYVSGFPFSSYGEGAFLLLQTLMICSLVLQFNVSSLVSTVFTAAFAAIFYFLVNGVTPAAFLWNMQSASVPIMFAGKLFQAYSNYQNGGTGQLSVVTCTLLLFGSLARIFTTLQETGDFIIIITYLMASIGNAIIVAQFIYYSRKKKQITDKKNKAKKKM